MIISCHMMIELSGFITRDSIGQLTPSENTADVRNISTNHGYAI